MKLLVLAVLLVCAALSMADGPVDSYVINELNTSYVAYTGATNNCGGRRGDCGAHTYEMVRLPDPSPGDECCGC